MAASAAVAATALLLALLARLIWPWPVLAFFVLVPWLAILDRGASMRGSLASGWLLSILMQAFIFRWFGYGLADYAGAPRGLGILALLVLAPCLQPQLLLFAAGRGLLARVHPRLHLAPLAVLSACLYVGSEWALPKLFDDTLGHGLYGSLSMRQGAELAGVPGLTFVLVAANECVLATMRGFAANAFSRASFRAPAGRPLGAPTRGRLRDVLRATGGPASAALGLALGLAFYGSNRLAQLEADAKVSPVQLVSVGIVQADISHYGRLQSELGTYKAVREILDAHFALSREALGRAQLDLLIWPETVYPTTFGAPKSKDGAAFDQEIAAFVAETGVPLVFGAYGAENGDEYNAAVFLEPDLEMAGRVSFDTYHKVRLFPFTERAPGFIEATPLRALLPWVGHWKPGARAKSMRISLPDGRELSVAPLICYDAIDPTLAHAAVEEGADLIVTLSNDSWFSTGLGPAQHLMSAAFRSIETRRPQVRSTSTGISAVIDAAGTVTASLGVHEMGILVERVPLSHARGRTPTVLAACLGPVCAALGATAIGFAFSRRFGGVV